MEKTFELSRPGRYNEVALLMTWPLSEVYCKKKVAKSCIQLL